MKTNKLGLITIVITILCTLLIGFFITASCEKPTVPNTPQSDNPALLTTQDSTNALAGTKWKLRGIVNTLTGELTILEPQDCSKCYTFTFDTDSTVSGYSIFVPISLNLYKLGSYMSTYIGEFYDGNKYRDALCSPNTNSYTLTLTEFRIINNIDNYYLLYNPYDYENK
jgi:hypothetical protein